MEKRESVFLTKQFSNNGKHRAIGDGGGLGALEANVPHVQHRRQHRVQIADLRLVEAQVLERRLCVCTEVCQT